MTNQRAESTDYGLGGIDGVEFLGLRTRFNDQDLGHVSGPNENWRFRIRCASSIPLIVMAAFKADLKPVIHEHRRLIARWSCSTMLFRYGLFLTRTYFHLGSSRRKSRSA